MFVLHELPDISQCVFCNRIYIQDKVLHAWTCFPYKQFIAHQGPFHYPEVLLPDLGERVFEQELVKQFGKRWRILCGQFLLGLIFLRMMEFVNDRPEPFTVSITRIFYLNKMRQLLDLAIEFRFLAFLYKRNTILVTLLFWTPMVRTDQQLAGGFDVLLAVTEAEIDGGLCIPYRSFWPFFV